MIGIKVRHVLLVAMVTGYSMFTADSAIVADTEPSNELEHVQVARFPVISLAKKEAIRAARELLEYIKEKAKKAARIRKGVSARSWGLAEDQYERYRRFGMPIPGLTQTYSNKDSDNHLYNDRRYGSGKTTDEPECDCSDYYYVDYDDEEEEPATADDVQEEYYEDYGPCYDQCLEEHQANRDWENEDDAEE